MVALIVEKYGQDAIAAIAAAWRDGAGDDEALEAGTGVPVDELYDTYFASFGAAAPTAIEPAPILPSNVDKPPQPTAPAQVGESASPVPSPSPSQAPGQADDTGAWIQAAIIGGILVGVIVAVVANRRRGSRTA